MIHRQLRVIRLTAGPNKDKFVSSHQYSQGISSYGVTGSIRKAMDVPDDLFNLTHRCFFTEPGCHPEDKPQAELYAITLKRINP